MTELEIGIDASRNRSGGAISHMVGLIGAADPEALGISRVHVWSYQRLLDALPARPWLVKHNPPELERGMLQQMAWQRWKLPGALRDAQCKVLLNTSAGTLGKWRPAVTMSRDMQSYEPGVMERYGFGKAWLRLFLLRLVQNRSLRAADAAVFLTKYAAEVIQRSCGPLKSVAIIPHGVGEEFRGVGNTLPWGRGDIRCVYVSNVAPYKHQWEVVRAVQSLRDAGLPLKLRLVGGGRGRAQERLIDEMRRCDPEGLFVEQIGFVPHAELVRELETADVFIFASSCENMPNTLVEGMAAAMPIACSDRGPMPEVLQDGGVYFDPDDYRSIAAALRTLCSDAALRRRLARRAHSLAEQFSWQRCAEETFSLLVRTANSQS